MKRRKDDIRLECVLVSEPPSIEMAEIDPVLALSILMRMSQTGNSELP